MKSKQAVYSLSTILTDARIDKLSNLGGIRPLFVRDTRLPGFGLKVSSQDTKSFFVEARRSRAQGGASQRFTLGQYPFLTIPEARKKALEALKALRYSSEGIRKETASGADLRALADAFLAAKEATLRSATLKDYRMVLDGSYFQAWMGRPPTSITRRDVLDAYTRLCVAHGIGMANKATRILSSLLNFGKATFPALENWANPVSVLSETRSRKPLKPRTGHIPINSLYSWLNAVDLYTESARSKEEKRRRHDISLLLNLLLMTGLRSNEARSLRWDDLDLEDGTLTICSAKAKNGKQVTLPLNKWLTGKLAKRKVQCVNDDRGEYVFPNPTVGHIRNLRRPLQSVTKLSGIAVTPHDLRRTFATYLDAAGVPFGAIKQLLNHASGADVTARYIQARSVDSLRPYVELVANLVIQQHQNGKASTNRRVPE